MTRIQQLQRGIFLIFFILFVSSILVAQPANDECENAILLTDVDNWCSENEAYNNNAATSSDFLLPDCFGGVQLDVWFKFVAIATDVTIKVEGASGVAPGGTFIKPEITMHSGGCSTPIGGVTCVWDIQNNNIIELSESGLTIGETYYIRVQARNAFEGSFQLCVNNYNAPIDPGSDCIAGSILCEQSSFVVQQTFGAGNDQNEIGSNSCLSSGAAGETNSTWFLWEAAEAGDLVFTLTPLNETDDLDFILFELPNGIGDCSEKVEKRCMAAGDFGYPSPCMGATGLDFGNTDVSEQFGCQGGNNNFLAPLAMEAGKTYALMINNFSGTGNGFTLDFEGSLAGFKGPSPDITANLSSNCVGQTVEIQDNSTSSFGAIVSWEWNFGVGAEPATATGADLHQVVYSTPGTKYITLVVETEKGCKETKVITIEQEPCCALENTINTDATITDLVCINDPTGAIDLTINSNSTINAIAWDNGETTEDIAGLSLGDYSVTISNQATCDTVLTYTVGAPDALNVEPVITKPSCSGGMDGAVSLTTTGGLPPYTYAWSNGNTTDGLTNIGVNDYTVTVTDSESCELVVDIAVRELELVLDASVPTVTPPSCHDTSDGRVVFNVANGLAPFEFDFNDGNGFVNTNLLTGLNAGIFTVTFRDGNGCLGDTIVEVIAPDTLKVVAITEVPLLCAGSRTGKAEVSVEGGTSPYYYEWSDENNQTEAIAVGLDTGIINVVVRDTFGCMVDTFTRITQPSALDIQLVDVQDVICYGERNGQVAVEGSGGLSPYTFSMDTFVYQVDSLFSNLASGNYFVYVRDINDCVDSVLVTVEQPFELIVDIPQDTTVDLGYGFDMEAVFSPYYTDASIQWTPAEGIECDTCFITALLPLNTARYIATVTDTSGCTAQDSILVTVNKLRPLFIPNAFSPDYDGINDIFTAYGNPAAQRVRTMQVFNRWGGLVYDGSNLPLGSNVIGWDGHYNGKKLDAGVYIYYMIVDFIDGYSQQYEGSITIIH